MRTAHRRLLPLLLVLSLVGCASAPPNLTPQASADFQKTRVLKALDLVRDFAIAAEAQTPKVLPTATTRTIVQYHKSTVTIMLATDSGWASGVSTSLNELVRNLSADDQQKFSPYVALVRTLLSEVTR